MNRREILVSLLFDIVLTQVAVLYSFYLRFGYEIPQHEFANYLDIFPFFILVAVGSIDKEVRARSKYYP